jgi:hypothetical protein
MRSMRLFLISISILGLLFPVESSAQRGMKRGGSGGWGTGSSYNRLYDPKTVETVSGEVISVDRIVPMKGMSYGIHLTLKTDSGTISVHVGPEWFLENQDTKIAVKDKIEITGSKIIFQGKPAIIASEVKKGEKILSLRDSNGTPLWSGWRRR